MTDRISQAEATGRTLEEASQRAADALGAERADVDIEVLDEGTRGVFGIGARDTRVRATLRGAGEEETLRAFVVEVLRLMGFGATVSVEYGSEVVKVDVAGDDLGALIGKHGQTLAAVESLLGAIAGRKLGHARIEVEVAGYRERRRRVIEALARRAADRVLRQQREVMLEPMSARERRIVHTALQDHPHVMTTSRGEGEFRRVVVMLRAGSEGPQPPSVHGRERPPTVASRGTSRRPGGGPRPGTPPSHRAVPPHARRSEGAGTPSANHAGRTPSGAERRTPNSRRHQRWSQTREARPQGRPEGLPVDEELEAEIQAHLERTQPQKINSQDQGDEH